MSSEKVLPCHGSFETCTCTNDECKYKCPGQDIYEAVMAQQVAQCPVCKVGVMKVGGRATGRGSEILLC